MELQGVEVEDRPSGVRVLTLCNEAKRNALNPALVESLHAELSAAATAPVRAILVRGAGGKAFCSGYDVSSIDAPQAAGALPDDRLMETLHLLQHHPLPTVALVEGPAFGAGCDLAAACDFRIGTSQTVFCLPPAKLGVVYAPEGLYRMSALVGRSRAKLMFFTGRKVDAATALEWGLLDELHPPTHASVAADEACEELAACAPLALRGMKRGFALLAGLPLSGDAQQEMRELRRAAFRSEDSAEGRAAFLEKRKPRFNGR